MDSPGTCSLNPLSAEEQVAITSLRSELQDPLGRTGRYGARCNSPREGPHLAREVFVGTLGTIFGIERADEDPARLADQITASGLTVASGAALVVFFTIALQYVSNVALLSR